MKIALSAWENRIAPVFDVASTILLVEDASDRAVHQSRELLPVGPAARKAMRLAELGVDTLVCGAISGALEMMVGAYGIEVVAFVAGDVDEVLRAFRARGLSAEGYAMPGCGHRRQHSNGQSNTRELKGRRMMAGGNKGGMGQGSGRGQGRGSQRGGRKGGGSAGPQGFCVCPQCGQRAAHQRGAPCYERKCPQCGVALVRE